MRDLLLGSLERLARELDPDLLYEGEDLTAKVVRYRRERRKEETIVIPKAITTRVRREKVSILTTDAQTEFDGSRSVVSLGIRSAITVPLWYKGSVIGIIHVDEDRHTVRTGHAPLAWAIARDTAISALRLTGHRGIAKALRATARQPERALQIIGLISEKGL